jgi:ATP sulfurylase
MFILAKTAFHASNFAKLVSIRKEAILSVPYEVYSMSSMFHCKKIRKLHVQKICENGPGKNPRGTGTSLADLLQKGLIN